MNHEQRVVLVTGANRGIGREVARQLAAQGDMVILAARDPERAVTAAAEVAADTGVAVRPLELDVSKPASIDATVAQLTGDPGRLDVLINNAGIGKDFGIPGTAPDFDAIQETLETNFYGAYRLTVGLLPLLRASGRGRVVNVSSGMGGVAEMGGSSPGYRVSKAALNAMTRILAAELASEPVLVNSACPGFVATDMGRPFGAQKPVSEAAKGIVWLASLEDDGPRGGFFRDGNAIAF
jgi:NAD(P)-dependent dehydrogenase (short-subunit alcohol dehydrogenase family)